MFKARQCAEAACQTCEKVLTRSQFETLMKATSERYMSTLERMQVQMEQNVGTILALTRQFDRQTVREPDTAKSSLSFCSHAVDLYADSPSATSRDTPSETQFHQADRTDLAFEQAPQLSDLQALQERHVAMKRQLRQQRRPSQKGFARARQIPYRSVVDVPWFSDYVLQAARACNPGVA